MTTLPWDIPCLTPNTRHQWKLYIGLTDGFFYCSICNEKSKTLIEVDGVRLPDNYIRFSKAVKREGREYENND